MLIRGLSLLVLLAPLAASVMPVLSPRRAGGLHGSRIPTFFHFASFAAAVPLLVSVSGPENPVYRLPILTSSWEFLTLSLSIDRLSAVMMVLISGIGAIIHLYSVRFMIQEEGAPRFHALLSLAVAVLLFMVTSASLVMLFIFWQLLSWILSLLAYNHAHLPTARGAFRTFIMLRAGDVFFLCGIVLAYHLYHTVDFSGLFLRAASDPTLYALPGGLASVHAPTLLALLIFVGAMSKSAQIPLHMWLPDSLYAPTPVHALLHAGIINAGGFLLNRLAPLYGQSPAALHVVFAVGLLTAMLGACMMLTQNDIKKTLGYSTIGQMGYMIMECGLGAFALAIFHLIAHGLFKATIFLNCGNVIHLARQELRPPPKTETGAPPEFSFLPWATGLLTTLILPLVIVLSLEGVLSTSTLASKGETLFLFFSWITSAQAILTLYRLRAFGSWKATLAMLLVLALVMATYLVAVKRFVFFLYPQPGVVDAYFRAASLPGPLFVSLIAGGALSILVYWLLILAKRHGHPAWISPGKNPPARRILEERALRLFARLYLFFMNRLYLDALALELSRRCTKIAQKIDRSRWTLPALAIVSVGSALSGTIRMGPLPPGSLLFLVGAAFLLPLFPFHGLYVAALTRLSKNLGSLPAVLALALPALGLLVAAEVLPHLPLSFLEVLPPFAFSTALYGSVKALVATRPPAIIAYGSLSLYGIFWWSVSVNAHVTLAQILFAGAVAWTAGGLSFAWDRLRVRYGDLDLTRLTGLARSMPRLSFLTGLLIMAGGGLPPFGLFIGFLSLFLAPSMTSGLSGAAGSIFAFGALFFVWFMASWILFRLVLRLFFGSPRPDVPYEDLRTLETAPLVVAIAALLFIAFLPYGCPGSGGGSGLCRLMGPEGRLADLTWTK